VWTNSYHTYPAHAAFGGYKSSGIGPENHKMMLDDYQQTKNLLVLIRSRLLTPDEQAALASAPGS
jgi:acyl-CoA reductase-like NAD-dependent aldehyde dehydrogenase